MGFALQCKTVGCNILEAKYVQRLAEIDEKIKAIVIDGDTIVAEARRSPNSVQLIANALRTCHADNTGRGCVMCRWTAISWRSRKSSSGRSTRGTGLLMPP